MNSTDQNADYKIKEDNSVAQVSKFQFSSPEPKSLPFDQSIHKINQADSQKHI